MTGSYAGAIPSLSILGAVALAAFARMRPFPPTAAGAERRAAAAALLLATSVQAAHFTEEAYSGFHAAFPAMFGLPAIPFAAFVAFNVAWLAAWLLAVPALAAGNRLAMFAAWFLALAALLNGIAHPALAIAAGAYFPGLVTSPLIALAGLRLARALP
ncbi:MAG: HXXEE domain-containing protein [Woeseiaceae bacterium]|nr:HXXEE domain-containing protein [Woeseiaceae bacterium]